MDKIPGNALSVSVFLPLAAGFILLFLPNKIKLLPKALALLISVGVFALAVRIFAVGEADFNWSMLQIDNLKLELLLSAKPLGAFILMFAMGFGLLITLYSFKSRGGAKRANEYYGAILLTIGGSAGILLSNHLLFLLIFWEIVTVALYVLISTGGKNSNFAATKSFAMIGASDGALLLGIIMVWALSGTFVISDITLATNSALSITAFLLLMTAAITKAGALPLHTWLPTSGEFAPTSVMALLPGAIDKLLGIYLLVTVARALFEIKSAGLILVMAIIGAATVIIAAMMALVQRDIKKLLSYSAISQVGYMVLGIATATTVGLVGAVFHMLNNAIYKSCLFLATGSVEKAAGTVQADQLGGLGKKMPITFTVFLIAALSVSGVPPFNGFVSKWMIYQGLIQMPTVGQAGTAAKLWPLWLFAAIFGSALTLAYSVKIIHSIFLSRCPEELKGVKEASPAMTIPMIILAGLCVLFGVFYHVPLKLFIYPALNIEEGVIFGTWQSALATGMIIIGVVIGLILLLVGLLARKAREVPTWTCGEVQDNEQMIIPGTHFYKTVSSMGGLKQLYTGQEKGRFDLYDQGGKAGMGLTKYLQWLHCGILGTYLTWVTLGLLVILFVVCRIW